MTGYGRAVDAMLDLPPKQFDAIAERLLPSSSRYSIIGDRSHDEIDSPSIPFDA